MVIARQHLRRDVLDEILDRLASGQLPVGRINESTLSVELGISRTPLREALLVLEQRGLVDSSMGKGFHVPALDLAEAHELYSLLAVLEPLAVRASVDALRAQIPQLHAVLDQMAAARDPQRLSELSRQWSSLLLGACRMPRLRSILEDLHRLAARYERANIGSMDLSGGEVQQQVVAAHRAIVDALAGGDVESAAAALAATWNACLSMTESAMGK